MALPRSDCKFLTVGCIKSQVVWLVAALLMGSWSSLRAQSVVRIDTLPDDGLLLRSGWRWHPGDNLAWAKADLNDSHWDTIHPTRNIVRVPVLKTTQQGWLRLTFTLDSALAKKALVMLIGQSGASEIYLDGALFQRLGRIGATFEQQQGYKPSFGDAYPLPGLSAGRHTLAVRLSLPRPPWYLPKFIYFNQSVFSVTVYTTDRLTYWLTSQVYVQTLCNYLLAGVFLMLGVIHLLYYRYRRKPVNLIFCLTMLMGVACIVLIQVVGMANSPLVVEWLFLVQGLFVTLFMLFLLATYYVYLNQKIAWHFWAVGFLLLIPRIYIDFSEPSMVISAVSIMSVTALFADGIRISIDAVRNRRVNARFMLVSILIMVLIILGGGLVSWLLSSKHPLYSVYSSAVTNMLFFLTLPISFAVILAREYAQTNRNLEDRLTEVAQLSKEKETLLTQQNETLERQVAERTVALTQSLAELRETQQQLIQREKMASLGELTAGIAHEIQNPLNFVNNFAEVSTELVQELKQELEKDSPDDELEAEILTDLEQNLQKITHHGSRASSIVRGMLDHSRTSTGQAEPTDLNALADEYLRLSYHGLRAKNKQFNATLITRFDPALDKVTVVAQDIGRVLLNLFNNAFYAVQERQLSAPPGYEPTLILATRKVDGMVEIRVSDNGTGIPEAIRQKIFNPFFTTKPTGQGTGLGLSLSYDIITKGHGGLFILDDTADEGATFLIRLPIQ